MPEIKYKKGEQGDRPWGKWEVVEVGENFIVKKITVKPEAVLSLQRHKFRGEHWIIVSGDANVKIDETSFAGKQDMAFYIPKKSWHRIQNVGKDNLIFIEVQTGDALDEADIERKEDKYGRV